MKGRYCVVLFILLFLSACNGKRVETRSALEKMLESRIHLPKEVRCVYEGEEIEISSDFRKKPKLLVYIDSVNCGECQISKFFRFDAIRCPCCGQLVEAMGIHHGPAKSINHCR